MEQEILQESYDIAALESLLEDEAAQAEVAETSEEPEEKQMTSEEINIESLKIAINISKLMKDVMPDDVVAIAGKVAEFIRNHQIGGETNTETSSSEEITSSTETPETV